MLTENNNRPSNKLLIAAFLAIFFTFAGTAWVLYYLGLFSDVKLEKIQAPVYRFAYLSNTGPYTEVKHVFKRVADILDKANIRHITACALLMDDPSAMDNAKLRSKIGYLVTSHDSLPTILQSQVIPGREVITAKFDGTPVVGSFKAYSAMKEWAQRNGYKLSLPSFEIYNDDGTVEYQLPISKELPVR